MEIITAKEAARRCGIAYPTMRAWLNDNRIGGAVKFQRDWNIYTDEEGNVRIVKPPNPKNNPKKKRKGIDIVNHT